MSSGTRSRTRWGDGTVVRYAQLTNEGPALSVMGMGCWGIGGASPEWGWGELDDETSAETLHAALDVGINWFDTAPTYGLGHSEEVVGKVLQPVRGDVVIATKFGRVWDEAGHLGRCGRYEWIVKECEASLRRLGTDYIDLYQMHWPDDAVPVEESMRAAADLVASGKVRYIGVCNFTTSLLQRAATVCTLTSHQLPYSLLQREVELDVLPYGREHHLPALAYSPLELGLLSGRLSARQSFAPGDWRATDERFHGDLLRHYVEVTGQLSGVAREQNITLPQLAIAWVLRADPVASAIVGGRTPRHVIELADASDVVLDAGTLARIEAIVNPIAGEGGEVPAHAPPQGAAT